MDGMKEVGGGRRGTQDVGTTIERKDLGCEKSNSGRTLLKVLEKKGY